MVGRLTGTVALLDAGGEGRDALARALVARGAAVVLVADDAADAGRVAAALGGRTAVFCPGTDADADAEALAELAADLVERPSA